VTLKFPALQASCEAHTVKVGASLLSGFLVRCTASRKELGYVWQAGSSWRWRTPSGANSGERSSAVRAVEVLRQAFDLSRKPGEVRDPRPIPSPEPRVPVASEARRASRPEPAAPRIVWPDAVPDLTAAIAAALKRGGK
jgi:hypothetical protein